MWGADWNTYNGRLEERLPYSCTEPQHLVWYKFISSLWAKWMLKRWPGRAGFVGTHPRRQPLRSWDLSGQRRWGGPRGRKSARVQALKRADVLGATTEPAFRHLS